jgi:hypothetical protein
LRACAIRSESSAYASTNLEKGIMETHRFNGSITELCATIEREIAENDAAIARNRREVESYISEAEQRGAKFLDVDSDVRSERLFSDIERLRAANRRLEARLARAREVESEERQNESRLDAVTRFSNGSDTRSDRRTATLSVTRNERTYRPDTDPHGVTFLRDVANNFLFQDPISAERLQNHAREERVERPQYHERVAGDVNSVNWSGLVVPNYLVNLVAPQISNLRPFADECCVKHPLPPSGMSVNFSKVTTGSSVALQATELSTVSGTSMDDTLGTANVQTAAGFLNVSRQAIERGTGIEQQSFLDLSRKYAVALDSTLITQASTGLDNVAQTVTYTDASPTPALMWPFIAQANSKLEQALVGVAYPTHVIMHSRRFNWFASYVSTNWPFISNSAVPAQQGGMQLTTAYGDGVRAILSNGLKVIVDNNVPTNQGVGTNQDVVYVVAANETMHLFEDPNAPVYVRAEQPNATTLGVLLVLYGYFAYATRYANPASKIVGTGTVAPAGF